MDNPYQVAGLDAINNQQARWELARLSFLACKLPIFEGDRATARSLHDSGMESVVPKSDPHQVGAAAYSNFVRAHSVQPPADDTDALPPL
jgi:hypothetical protein